ncbi:hypothetical protein L228DRAFT_267224 [Xylona heveae TC161]|uniref:Uncharacterized protein n=1 Tax=Xylona heveae (strain CBS 132557 / TC161) TaxID=1328760 RepID=A0A165HAE4_XYLHT|nr:hypothetical protein L228DRAFT_267224 [Xylona heveae TC161]KZF23210.1 hypothetical protein L228DRAFT_267224 [Xylona heveae TC161]
MKFFSVAAPLVLLAACALALPVEIEKREASEAYGALNDEVYHPPLRDDAAEKREASQAYTPLDDGIYNRLLDRVRDEAAE